MPWSPPGSKIVMHSMWSWLMKTVWKLQQVQCHCPYAISIIMIQSCNPYFPLIALAACGFPSTLPVASDYLQSPTWSGSRMSKRLPYVIDGCLTFQIIRGGASPDPPWLEMWVVGTREKIFSLAAHSPGTPSQQRFIRPLHLQAYVETWLVLFVRAFLLRR